jgi:hypothetical protein
MTALTTCPRCNWEDVTVLAGMSDFNATTVTVTPCQFDDPSAASVVYRKSAVLAAEAENEKAWED